MADGETKLMTMIESLLERKLGEIVATVIHTQVTGQILGLRDEIAALKLEICSNAVMQSQQQAECQASIMALQNMIPGSHPSTQNSGTTLSSGAEFKPQPIPDAEFEPYWNPPGTIEALNDFGADMSENWSDRATRHCDHDGSPYHQLSTTSREMPDLLQHSAPNDDVAHFAENADGGTADANRMPVTSLAPLSALAGGMTIKQQPCRLIGLQQYQPTPSTMPSLSDRRSPAYHRQHNPKSCMICRGTFVKLSNNKDHMLKCFKPNAQCQFRPNCDHHQQLIRPFSGATTELRWKSAVAEWIHRKA